MKRVSLDNVQQGEYLARPIYSSDGRVLLAKDVQLAVGLLSRLRHMGVTTLYIHDEQLKDIEIEEAVTEETKRKTVQALSNSFQYIQEGKKDFTTKEISQSASSIIDDILANPEVLTSAAEIRTKDNDIYIHSVNVCIISILMATKLNVSRSKLEELAIGALLHDMGKITPVPKVQPPHDEEEGDPNHHSWLGFNYLRKKRELSMLSSHVALQHHENIDGTGQPRGIEGNDIHLYAKIVAVANYFDRLIAPIDGESVPPYIACERIMGLTNIRFDHEIVWQFLRSIAFYPTGSQVKLSNGEVGVVVGQNTGLPQRPVIRIFQVFNNDEKNYNIKEINLAKEPTMFIEKILE